MDAITWLTIVLACAAVASAVFAYVQARAATESRKDAQTARSESLAARDEATRLAAVATTAFVRQAEAQEEANRLAEEALPKKVVQFEVKHVKGDTWGLFLRGDFDLDAVTISGAGKSPELIRPDDDDQPKTLTRGDHIRFWVLPISAAGRPRLAIDYLHPEDGLEKHLEINLAT
jgi:hypothetical protein